MKVREPTKSLGQTNCFICVILRYFFQFSLHSINFLKMSINFINSGCSSYGSNDSLENYDPSLHRKLDHPTSNIDTMIHLLKGNIGTGNLYVFFYFDKFSYIFSVFSFYLCILGILAMPDAFKNAGLYVGLFGTMLMGIICTHCMHMLVGCSHELCRRQQVPSMSFPEVCYNAFQTGPQGLRRYSNMARYISTLAQNVNTNHTQQIRIAFNLIFRFILFRRQTINLFLCITQLGFCCVYFVFVAVNLQEVIAHYFVKLDIRMYLLLLLIPMIMLNFLKNLKYLTPVSLFASILTVTGISITFHYMLQNLPHTNTVKAFSSWEQLPLYFGTAIYAFEGILQQNLFPIFPFGKISLNSIILINFLINVFPTISGIGVVLPLENNMKTPQDFGGLTGVLNTGMVIVASLYTAVGFFGYLKYGENVAATITLNLDPNAV